jgi:phospholipase C
MDIQHVVVLMLENRSFDCMLGKLYPKSAEFDGLGGTESNILHKADGSQESIPVWAAQPLTAQTLCIPDPDPGELFTDIHIQIHGRVPAPGGQGMNGFVDSYVSQSLAAAAHPKAVMHYFTPEQVPVISELARAFGVSDRWHASAPCQTWPNRFFAHTGTANGYVNNAPAHFPYRMETVFHRLVSVKQSWRIYYHDIPQAAVLAELWFDLLHFRDFESFAQDAAAGSLPAYSFIEPRYFADPLGGTMPNDQHPPQSVALGEALIAAVYNAVRSGPGWKQTLLVITYDEHGGCYDHVLPPRATPPDGKAPDGFAFDSFGVRVPAVIVSPYVKPGCVIRPKGPTPFDHTSIIATLARRFGFQHLTERDKAAPSLLDCPDAFQATPSNDGPASITAPATPSTAADVARASAQPTNSLQKSLSTAAVQLPTAGADIGAHMARLAAAPAMAPDHTNVGAAGRDVTVHMKAFLGRP